MLRSGDVPDAVELTPKVVKIQLCNELSNHFVGEDMLSKSTGELFRGVGRLWRCNQRLCPSCLANFSRRNRKRLRNAIESRKLLTSEHRQLITLTIPEINESLRRTREVVHYAWTLFRKRKWFKKTILAGSKSEEFTFSKHRYHYHLHIFAITKYIFFAKFRTEWTECVQTAFAHFGLNFATCSDGKVNANVTKVYSLKRALHEVTKYITKQNTWSDIPEDQLLEVMRLKRWPRVFELFGEFRSEPRSASSSSALGEAEESDVYNDYLDKESISDGTSSVHVKNLIPTVRELIDLSVDVSNFRQKHLKFHHPHARFVRKKGSFPMTVDSIMRNCVQIIDRYATNAERTFIELNHRVAI